MAQEPIAGQARNLVEGTRLFEEMRRSRNDCELPFAVQMRMLRGSAGRPGRRLLQQAASESSPARSRRPPRETTAPITSGRKAAATIGKLREPVGRPYEPFGEQFDVEAQPCSAHVDRRLFHRKKFD